MRTSNLQISSVSESHLFQIRAKQVIVKEIKNIFTFILSLIKTGN